MTFVIHCIPLGIHLIRIWEKNYSTETLSYMISMEIRTMLIDLIPYRLKLFLLLPII
jgi:hypothetical protein